MKRLALLLVACAVIAVRADDYETVLQKDRLVIQEQINKINAAAKKALDAWPEKYLQSLRGLETELKKAGNLDGVLAIRKEVERFSQKKQITDETVVEMPEELRELQIQAMKEPGQIELRRNMQTVMATDEYVAILDELKKRLTKKGNVEQALVLHKETERAKKTAEYTAAKFVLDAAGVEASVPRAASVAKSESVPRAANVPKKLLEGLVLYYSFDKDSGTIVTDASGNGKDGQMKGAAWTKQGKRGGAYDFDGRSSLITSPAVETRGDVTWSVWFKARSFPKTHDTYAQILGLRANAWVPNSHNTSLGFINHNGFVNGPLALYFLIQGQRDSVFVALAKPPDVSVWHHAVAVSDGSGTTLYFDGKLVGRNADPIRFGSAAALIVGAQDQGSSRYFDGLIDEVMVFERALSETEIKTLYNAK